MEFVLVERFKNYIQANIAKGMLEANDIVCWLQDENLGTIGMYSDGIKLMVSENQAQRALDLINDAKNRSAII
jgi:hypothetical protein